MERKGDLAAAVDGLTTHPASLTPREREVVVLVAEGHSNRRIAQELVGADSTSERHVDNIVTKLVCTQAEIAVWALEHGLTRVQPEVQVGCQMRSPPWASGTPTCQRN